MVVAAAERDQRALERKAWGLSLVMSIFTKKPVTVDDLLGRKPKRKRGEKRVFLEDVLNGGEASLEEKLQKFDENWKKRKELRRRKTACPIET